MIPPFWTDGRRHPDHPLAADGDSRGDVLDAEELSFVDDGRKTDPDPRPWHVFLNTKGPQQ